MTLTILARPCWYNIDSTDKTLWIWPSLYMLLDIIWQYYTDKTGVDLNPNVGKRPVITYAYLSQVDRVAQYPYKKVWILWTPRGQRKDWNFPLYISHRQGLSAWCIINFSHHFLVWIPPSTQKILQQVLIILFRHIETLILTLMLALPMTLLLMLLSVHFPGRWCRYHLALKCALLPMKMGVT